MSLQEVLIVETPVIQTVTLEQSTKTKARFKAVLQAVDVPGRNRRRYRRPIIEQELNAKKPMMESRTFLGELDHPVSQDPIRNSTVLLQNVSHAILDAYIDKGKVYGVLETLSTPNGKILYDLVVHDRVPVGFSLRAIGSVRQESGFLDVVRMTMITYDAVSNPSFTEARIQEVSLAEMAEVASISDQQTLLEHDMICIGDKCYLVEHLDKILDDALKKEVGKLLWGF